ncbi:hypothetical protein ACTFIW_003769 [Dictyostelium discoideum]
MKTGDYSTFQSHVIPIIHIKKSSKAELLIKSWELSTLKVYSSSFTRFRNFCTLNPTNITLPPQQLTSSSSSSSHVSSSTGNIPRSIDQTIGRVNTNPNSTTLETGDYSTFQYHVMSIIRIQKSSTADLLMKSWEPSTLKVYSSSYTRFRNFCISNSLNPANITLVVFMDYLTHLFKHKPPLAFSTFNGHRSMLNQLLLLKNQTDIFNDPFITRIMTGIHKLRPSSAKYQEIRDANQVFKYLSTIKVIPKYTYTALLKKTLVLCKMFGLARSSDLVKWSFNGLIITPDSIKGPVVNAKEQRKGVLSILELTSLDDINSQVCPVRHLSTYLRASKGRRKPHSGDSVFIQNEGKPLDVKEINIIVLSTLSSSGIDISKFKSHSTRSAMASLLLSNNVPFHVVKKMGRWKSNDTVDTFYDKRIIGEKSGEGFQTKSRKECSRTNPINYVSRIANRFGINEASCSQRKEEKCHKGNKKLFKARLLLPKKTCWFIRKANRTEGCSDPIQTLHLGFLLNNQNECTPPRSWIIVDLLIREDAVVNQLKFDSIENFLLQLPVEHLVIERTVDTYSTTGLQSPLSVEFNTQVLTP